MSNYVNVNAINAPKKLSRCYPAGNAMSDTCKATVPIQDNFIDRIEKSLIILDDSIGFLENLKANISPSRDLKDEPMKDPTLPITFDYIWGSLPDRLFQFSGRLSLFSNFVDDLIYKNDKPTSEGIENIQINDHLHKIYLAMNSVDYEVNRAYSLSLSLSGELKGQDCDSDVKEAIPNFLSVWRALPDFLGMMSGKLSETHKALTRIFYEPNIDVPVCDSALEKH